MCPINKLVYPGGFLSGQFPSKSVYPTTSFGKCTHHNCLYIWPEFTLGKKKKGEGMIQAELIVWQTPIIIKMSDSWKAFCLLWCSLNVCIYFSSILPFVTVLVWPPPASLQPLNTLSTSLFLPGLFREMSVSLYRNQSRIFLPAFSH